MTSAPGGERRYPKSYRWKGGCGDYILPGEGVNNAVNIPEVICTWLLKAPSLIKNRCVWCLRLRACKRTKMREKLYHTNASNIVEVFHIRFDLFPLATVARVSHVRSVLPSSNSSSSICHHHGSLPPNLTVSSPSPAMLHIMIKSRLARVTSDCLSDSAWAVRSAQIGRVLSFT